ncbi:hypothetical protein [Argonema galeatum]|nr:hypothetical protein [Argonema galeatum]MCL1468731.1 hypothetical protein [Argonema galeatum A003/A1]
MINFTNIRVFLLPLVKPNTILTGWAAGFSQWQNVKISKREDLPLHQQLC